MNSHVGSFRETFSFITPARFQQAVASNPAPPPDSQWKYPINHEEMNTVPGPKTLNPKSLYLFGKKDEIKDLEMEDGFSGVADPPFVVDGYQTVSVCGCRSTVSDAYSRQTFPSQENRQAKIYLGSGPRCSERVPREAIPSGRLLSALVL